MTELAERFIAALTAQGYGVIFQDGDMVILGANPRGTHNVPREILTNEEYNLLLIVSISSFASRDGRFDTDPVFRPGHGGAGQN